MPFGPGEHAEVLHQILTEPVPQPRALRPEVPPELDGIVVKCLEKDPADRYPTAAALADDLDRFLAGRVPLAPVLTRRRRVARWAARHRGWLWSAAAALVVGVGLFLAGRLIAPVQVGAAGEEPQAEITRRLQAGEKVVLLGETGRPMWADWPVGPSQFADAPEADGACTFAATGDALLELVRDPGIERYTVTAELRIVKLYGAEAALVGLYWGHATSPGRDGSHAHTYLAVSFNDHLSVKMRQAKLTQAVAQQKAGVAVVRRETITPFSTGNFPESTQHFPAADPPSNGLPGEWRRVRIEVIPGGVHAFFTPNPNDPAVPFRPLTDGEMGAIFRDRRTEAGTKCIELGVEPPGWQPRMPLGVWCRSANVAIRNIVIEPLP
jgi:serine/threonine-protein kinase